MNEKKKKVVNVFHYNSFVARFVYRYIRCAINVYGDFNDFNELGNSSNIAMRFILLLDYI